MACVAKIGAKNLTINNQKHQSNNLPKTIPVWLKEGAKIYNQNIAISSLDKQLSLTYRSLLHCLKETSSIPPERSLRFLVTGLDKIEATEIEKLENTFKIPLVQFYGMSEVSPLPAVRPFPPADTPSRAVGKVNPLWQFACVDKKGNHLPFGQEGEIILKDGYFNRLLGQKNQQHSVNIHQGWFYTGDLGYLDSEGFLYYTGRVDNRINRGGKKVYAKEFEAVLLTHPAIAVGVVFGIPDALYGECIGAVVVLHPDRVTTPDSIRQFVAERVADFKVLDRILIEEALPLNPFGKVKRKTLSAHYGLRDLFVQKSSQTSNNYIPLFPIPIQICLENQVSN